jgi:predicted transposase YdaD
MICNISDEEGKRKGRRKGRRKGKREGKRKRGKITPYGQHLSSVIKTCISLMSLSGLFGIGEI